MSRLSTDLLDQARRLASLDSRKPKQANLRRAVSTAYYSLFHLLVEDSSGFIVGAGARHRMMRQLVSRSFLHGGMRASCTEVLKVTPVNVLKPFWSALDIPNCGELQKVAAAFCLLQEERHRADYDLSATFSREQALILIAFAEEARADWKTLKRTRPEVAEFFSLSLLHIESWRKR